MNDSQSTEKDRSTLAKESAAALPTNPSEKESVMTNITDYTTIDLVAEAERRGLPVPNTLREQAPAGFNVEYHCSCGAECPPNEQLDEDCTTLGHSFTGPGVYLDNSNAQLNSYWDTKNGITFQLSNYKCADNGDWTEAPWTREQIEHVPNMVNQVLAQIDRAAAKEYLEQHPIKGTPTVNGLFALAEENNLKAPELFQAYMELTQDGDQ
ncbi:hypothetical protein [Glutamicibacter sp. BSL13]